MRKWIIIGIVLILVAAIALLLWQPWAQRGQSDTSVDRDSERFVARILEINGDHILVEPLKDQQVRASSDRISFSAASLEDIGAAVGCVVEIRFNGLIRETYPASIDVISWKMTNLHMAYEQPWLDKETAEKCDNNIFSDIVITEIYSDCFFANTVIPMPYTIKLNGQISADWCIGDQVYVTYENTYYDQENQRVEADLLTIEESDFEPDPNACYKPVIYLYPEQETEVSVFLELAGELTCTYPAYREGWHVTAAPDGTLTDAQGQTYNYLYWEGVADAQYDFSQGFCVKGQDTAAFLEQALAQLGLNRREANEFIVYWLPLMEGNPYNVISFQGAAYTEAAGLQVTPTPDTTIRVFMAWYGADSYVDIAPQQLTAPQRSGFTVIEWGGTEIS